MLVALSEDDGERGEKVLIMPSFKNCSIKLQPLLITTLNFNGVHSVTVKKDKLLLLVAFIWCSALFFHYIELVLITVLVAWT